MIGEILNIAGGAFCIAIAYAAVSPGFRTWLIDRLASVTYDRPTQEGDADTPPAHFNGMQWCPLCRGRLQLREVCGRVRLACTRHPCNFVYWDSPKPVVVGMVQSGDGLVLVRRKVNPAIGSWCLPGGFIERGETGEDAVVREVEEECGLKARIDRLVGAYASSRSVNEFVLVYAMTAVGGVLAASDDADAAEAYATSESLPQEIAFEQDRHFIQQWFEQRAAASQPTTGNPPNG